MIGAHARLCDVRDVARLVALVLMETLARGPGVPDGVLAPDRHVRWRMARWSSRENIDGFRAMSWSVVMLLRSALPWRRP